MINSIYRLAFTIVLLLNSFFILSTPINESIQTKKQSVFTDIPIYWAEADIRSIDGCCATLEIRVYQLFAGQTLLVYSGIYNVNLFGEEDCCPTMGFDPSNPLNSPGIYEVYRDNDEIKAAINNAIGQFLSLYGKTSFEETNNPSLNIFPMPAKQNLNVEILDADDVWIKYRIFSIDGQLIKTEGRKPLQGNILNIDVSNGFVSGVYYLELNINGRIDFLKFSID